MIYCLACRCHSAEPLIRKTMRECHREDWQTQNIVKGRPECMAALARFPQNEEIQKLTEYLKRVSSWSVILGVDGDYYRWADVGKGKTIDRLDAEKILEEF